MEQVPSDQLADHAATDPFGRVAGLLGIVGFTLRLASVVIPGVPGAIGQLVGLAFGIPALVLGVVSLSRPRHRKSMAVTGVVLGALMAATAIGGGIAT